MRTKEFMKEKERQEAYVASSLHRCPRCGDHAPSILPSPPLSILCGSCWATLRATDGELMWFTDFVDQLTLSARLRQDS
jgi:hypothetical protein